MDLKEGSRFLSLEEMNHIINLIDKQENVRFCMNVDLF